MFEDLNLPFHGVLLDPLIEDSCGPLINCDSCSTFDETSPFLAFPSSATFNGEYQLFGHSLFSLSNSHLSLSTSFGGASSMACVCFFYKKIVTYIQK
jgi:hypothetical protein